MKKNAILAACALLLAAACAQALTVSGLRVQSMVNPHGIEEATPCMSWQLASQQRGVKQASYQIDVTADEAGTQAVWTSGTVESGQSVRVPCTGIALQPLTRYWWRVTVTDNTGATARSTQPAYFDTGLQGSGWSGAKWIQVGAAGKEVADYEISLKFEIEAVAAGICFAGQDRSNFYMWQFNVEQAAPRFRPHVWNNGAPSVLAEVDLTNKVDLKAGTPCELRIAVSGGTTARTYLNGTLIDTRTGNFKHGLLGFREALGETAGNPPEKAYFDDVKVTTSDSTILSEDFEGASNAFSGSVAQHGGSRQLHVVGVSGGLFVWNATAASEGVPLFRKSFTLSKPVKSAMLVSTALGVYDAYINGQRVGHALPGGGTQYEELKPGWTDYNKRVAYQTHNVTQLLKQGYNAMGATVASGWWNGKIANNYYGSGLSNAFMAKLLVTYTDGTSETIVTDDTWRSTTGGPLRAGDIYDGETYDARLESDWSSPGYNDAQWNGTREYNRSMAITAAVGEPVSVIPSLQLKPASITVYQGAKPTGTTYGAVNTVRTITGSEAITLQPGQTAIYDLGQNAAGWPLVRLKGEAGTAVRLRFAEMLNDDGDASRANDGPGGSLYRANMRSAATTLNYIMAGKSGGEAYRPTTTFFGYRYVGITASAAITVESLVGEVISNDIATAGSITTSDDDVNKLFSNQLWGQRSNFVSVPTDCPQRDERLGWTADTQLFSRTATYNGLAEMFYRKWLQDLRDSQYSNGAYTDVAPMNNRVGAGNGVWADAGIVVPWTVYLMTGNKQVLRESFPSMERYMTWLSQQHADGLTYAGAGIAYGDWLAPQKVDNRYVSMCFYAYDATLMAKMAQALSETQGDEYSEKALNYNILFSNIRNEYQERYLRNGAPTQGYQTGYLLPLAYGLLPGETAIERSKQLLRQAIVNNGYRLSTGFLGTSILNPSLSQLGMGDLAYDLLVQHQYPSWLYSVDQGATTMWERWNSYTRDGGFGSAGMNSFNHYAYGAIGEWMYRYMLGIEPDEAQPGFQHFILQPEPDTRGELPSGLKRITWARGKTLTDYGTIESSWSRDAATGNVEYSFTVPANTTATVYLPIDTAKGSELTFDAPQQYVADAGVHGNKHVFEIGSGSYTFKVMASGVNSVTASASGKARVYPNPATSVLHIEASEPVQAVSVIDVNGSIVARAQGEAASAISVSNLAPGMYLVRIATASGATVAKFLKQ